MTTVPSPNTGLSRPFVTVELEGLAHVVEGHRHRFDISRVEDGPLLQEWNDRGHAVLLMGLEPNGIHRT
jgi:hypothetical protein